MQRLAFSILVGLSPALAFAQSPTVSVGLRLDEKPSITRADIEKTLAPEVAALVDSNGRVTPALQKALLAFEKKSRPRFDKDAAIAFQTIIAKAGARMNGPIGLPEALVPYWQKDPGPFEKFVSTPNLPRTTEYLVIGAGLGGTGAALNLASEVKEGRSVTVLEMGAHPAAGASGSNGGNIEMMKENFLEDYRGFVKTQKDFIKARYPDLPEDVLNYQAERQSQYLMRFFQANVNVVRENLSKYRIQADASMAGWLRVAETAAEEAGLVEEIAFAKKLGLEFEVWSPEKILEKTGIPSKFSGRYIKESGNFHPFKYVQGLMKAAVNQGVKLYTETKVEKVERLDDGTYRVHTNRGAIVANKVIMATNGYSQAVMPELDAIQPWISHIVNYDHTKNTFQGMTITRQLGDWYANFPKQDWYTDKSGVARGTLHVGGGLDTPIDPSLIYNPPAKEEVYKLLLNQTGENVGDTKNRPPSRFWSGIMGFTADRAPVLSFLWRVETLGGKRTLVEDKNLIVLNADSGYGGSQLGIASRIAAHMAKTGETPTDLIPDDIFSMRRFLEKEPLFAKSAPPIETLGVLKPFPIEIGPSCKSVF